MTKRQRRSVAVSLFLAAAMAMALPFFSFGENRTGSEDSDFSELLSEPEIEEFGLEEIEEAFSAAKGAVGMKHVVVF